MKFIFFFLVAITFVQIGNAAPASCLNKIASSETWTPLSEKQIECMKSDSNFLSSTKILCSVDESEVSAPYAKFLAYKVKIDEAFAKFQSATNPGDRSLANAELQDLKQAQSTFAYNNGIWDALNLISTLKYNCEQ